MLRRAVRSIVLRLREVDDVEAAEAGDRLRVLLSEWLTVPVSFDNAMLDCVNALGPPAVVEARYGGEIRAACDLARTAISGIQQTENPIRTTLRMTIRELGAKQRIFRIYCHRRARAHFESLFDTPNETPIQAGVFLHSIRDYRDTEPFDLLLKVGPLRSRGWGAAPDALLTAPRFESLVQIVWSGSSDEEDFGYDPVLSVTDEQPRSGSIQVPDRDARGHAMSWTREVILSGIDAGDPNGLPELDELKLFHELSRAPDMRRATLLQIDDAHGILYPPQSQVASLDLGIQGNESIGYRLPAETLLEGVFVLWAFLGDSDLGGIQAGEGHYSRIWKERLRDELRRDAGNLVRRLFAAGIDLQHLNSRVRRWWRPPSTVIHAPQQRKHFEILITVLGIDHGVATPAPARRRPWWQYAWNEIAQSRGEAIQSGMQEHEIIDEQLFAILNEQLVQIRGKAAANEPFQIEIPPGKPLAGAVRFYPVRSIDEGFLVPDTVLKTICDLDTIEQWRV